MFWCLEGLHGSVTVFMYVFHDYISGWSRDDRGH